MALTDLSWLYRSLGLVQTTGRGQIADQLGSGVVDQRRCRVREISFVSSVGVAGVGWPRMWAGLGLDAIDSTEQIFSSSSSTLAVFEQNRCCNVGNMVKHKLEIYF